MNLKTLTAIESIRDRMPGVCFIQHTGGGSFKSQLKKADKSGASLALIWGEDEVASQSVTLKPLRDSGLGPVLNCCLWWWGLL